MEIKLKFDKFYRKGNKFYFKKDYANHMKYSPVEDIKEIPEERLNQISNYERNRKIVK